jgi:hypothetical protein
MNQLSFSEFLIIREANQAIQEANFLLNPDLFLEIRAKDYWKQGKEVKKSQIAHIDPVTRKPWRSGDRTRQIKAIVKDQKRGGTPESDIYVSHSSVNKLGIYPKSGGGGTPFGIYGYPVKYFLQKKAKGENLYAHDRPYLQIFKIKRDKGDKKAKIVQFKPEGKTKRKRAKDFDLYQIQKQFEEINLQKGLQDLKYKIHEWIHKFYDKEVKKGELPEPTLTLIRKHAKDSVDSLIANLRSEWDNAEGKTIEEKLKNFKSSLFRNFDSFKEGMLEAPKYDYNIPTKYKHNTYDESLEEFIKRVYFNYSNYSGYGESTSYDYWGEHSNRYKYDDVDLEKNYAKFSDTYKKSLKERGITQEGESIDAFMKHNKGPINEYPDVERMWVDFKNKDKQKPQIEIVQSEFWKKAITAISKHIAKYVDWHSNNASKKLGKINFPFKKEIIDFSNKHGINWADKIVNANGSTPTQFLYSITQILGSNLKGGEFTNWTRVLRGMGIDGLADRQSAGHIYNTEEERSQAVFFHAGTLQHIAQIDQAGHTDDREISGRPNIKGLQMLRQFKGELGLSTKACSKAEVMKHMQDFLKSKGKTPSDHYDIYTKNFEIPWELDSEWNKYRNGKCSFDDAQIPSGYDDEWEDFLKRKFKKDHRIPPSKELDGDLEDKFRTWKGKFHLSGTTSFRGYTGSFDYRGAKPQQKSALLGTQIGGSANVKAPTFAGQQLTDESTLSRTIEALNKTIKDVSSDLVNIKQWETSDNDWHNKFNQKLTVLIKLLRSFNEAKEQYSKNYPPERIQQIKKKSIWPRPVKNMHKLEETLVQIDKMIQDILGNQNYKNMWTVWAAFKRNLETASKLIKGEFAGKLPRMEKGKMWGREEYEKAFHIYYPGEEFIRDLPKEMWTTDLDKIPLGEWRNKFSNLKTAAEKWKHLVQYQTNRHIIIDNKKYNELMSKFDWIEKDPKMVEFWNNDEINYMDASKKDPQYLYKNMNIQSVKDFDKLITYQNLMGTKHQGNTISKAALLKDFLKSIESYTKDPEFQKIPDHMKETTKWDKEDILSLTPSQFSKLLDYSKKTLGALSWQINNFKNEYMPILETIAKLGINKNSLPIITHTVPENISYGEFKRMDIPVAKAEEIINHRISGTFQPLKGQSRKRALNWIKTLKDVEEHGEEKDFYSKMFGKISNSSLNHGDLENKDYEHLPSVEDYKKLLRYLYTSEKISSDSYQEHLKNAPKYYDENGKLRTGDEFGKGEVEEEEVNPEDIDKDELMEFVRDDDKWRDEAWEAFWNSGWPDDERPSYSDIYDWEMNNPEPTSVDDWQNNNPEPEEDDYEEQEEYQKEFDWWDEQRSEIESEYEEWEQQKEQIESEIDNWENYGELESFEDFLKHSSFLDDNIDEIAEDYLEAN